MAFSFLVWMQYIISYLIQVLETLLFMLPVRHNVRMMIAGECSGMYILARTCMYKINVHAIEPHTPCVQVSFIAQ